MKQITRRDFGKDYTPQEVRDLVACQFRLARNATGEINKNLSFKLKRWPRSYYRGISSGMACMLDAIINNDISV